MKTIIFSIGEPTTELCYKALKRQGVDSEVWQDQTSFQDKFKKLCGYTGPVLRVDADIIVNDNLQEYLKIAEDWSQPYGWVWWSQDYQPISVNYYSEEVLQIMRQHLLDEGFTNHRPERYMWGLHELLGKTHKVEIPVGIKGYGIRDLEKTKLTKENRGQVHDWDFIQELNKL